MMKSPGVLLRWIDPRLLHLQYEEIIAFDQAHILHAAFEVAEAFLDERWADLTGIKRRQSKALEFVGVAARAIADFHHLVGKPVCWDCNHCLAGRAENAKAEIGVADDTGHERWLEIDHRVPGHGHDVRVAFARRRQQNDRTRLQHLVNSGRIAFP